MLLYLAMDPSMDNVTHQSAGPPPNVNWRAAFQSEEFCSGIQALLESAIAKRDNAQKAGHPEVAALERLGESSIPQSSAVSAAGENAVNEGHGADTAGMLSNLHAPSFMNISGSTSGPQLSKTITETPPSVPSLAVLPAAGSLHQAFILGPGRPPLPAKLVSQILTDKFVEMSELIPENLLAPSTEVPSFVIEGRSIVATTTASQRKKAGTLDVLSWVECFTSYMAVMTASYPSRARDLLAYMALIIRIAKQSPGRCWANYDRAFRLEAAASHLTNWSQINPDLYHYHTSMAAHNTPSQSTSNREPLGDQNSTIACKSWNSGHCSSPREFCRFRHRCNRNGCGGRHRAIHCQDLARKRGRSPSSERIRKRDVKRD